MRGQWSIGVVVAALVVAPSLAWAQQEHGGKEHAGKEHGGQEPSGATQAPGAPAASAEPSEAAEATAPKAQAAEPSAEEIRQTIRDYISQVEEEEGSFTIDDEVTGQTRTLKLERVHDRVGKTGELYYSCTDMRDTASQELLDLDFDVEAFEEGLDVVDVRIHKVNAKARYTYDQDDNRIPVTE